MTSPADWTFALPVSDVALNYTAGLLSGLVWAKPIRSLWDRRGAALPVATGLLVFACTIVAWALLAVLVLS